jgi:3',5'-cyclic AMP phosphodiesterase CpdA
MKLIHISDLHLSSSNYIPEWGDKVLEFVNSAKPDILAVTGDLTFEGRSYEYDIVKEYFDKLNVDIMLVVPGNHDARNEGFSIFEELFGTRYPCFADKGILMMGVDSSQPDIDDGHVGRDRYDEICEFFSTDSGLKVLMLHHHLIPIPGTGRERQIPSDAGDVLGLCKDLGIDIVLSGHKHKPWIWKLEDTHFVTAGTATTRRLKGRSHPSFNILETEGQSVVVKEVNVRDGSMKETLKFQTGKE